MMCQQEATMYKLDLEHVQRHYVVKGKVASFPLCIDTQELKKKSAFLNLMDFRQIRLVWSGKTDKKISWAGPSQWNQNRQIS